MYVFFPYIGKVFTLPSDLSLIYVGDTILIDFVALSEWSFMSLFEIKYALCSVLPAMPKKWENDTFSLIL